MKSTNETTATDTAGKKRLVASFNTDEQELAGAEIKRSLRPTLKHHFMRCAGVLGAVGIGVVLTNLFVDMPIDVLQNITFWQGMGVWGLSAAFAMAGGLGLSMARDKITEIKEKSTQIYNDKKREILEVKAQAFLDGLNAEDHGYELDKKQIGTLVQMTDYAITQLSPEMQSQVFKAQLQLTIDHLKNPPGIVHPPPGTRALHGLYRAG